MPTYTVEIYDYDGHSFQVELTLPFLRHQADSSNSKWKVQDEGFLKYRKGTCWAVSDSKHSDPVDLRFVRKKDDGKKEWGLVLYELFDTVLRLMNETGTGWVAQSWVTGLTPGKLKWTVLDDD